MPTSYRIVFRNPPNPDSYYHRDEILKIDGINQTRPLVSPNAPGAHTFSNRDSVIAFRDQFRLFYPKITIFIEDVQHNGPLFEEYGRESTETGEADTRTPMIVCPDDLVTSDLWFIVRPANTVQGKCWCVVPSDIPSLKENLGKIDTIYGRVGEPIDQVLGRARRHWESLGLQVQGILHPDANKRDWEETKQILQEFNQAHSPGRLRRPDLR